MTFTIYIIIGVKYALLSVVVEMKIEIAKLIRAELENDFENNDHYLLSKKEKWLFKNFVEIALMPNKLSNIISLVQVFYYFSLCYGVYKQEWLFIVILFFSVAILSSLLSKVTAIQTFIVLLFFRELEKKSYSKKLNEGEKDLIQKITDVYYDKIIRNS